MKLLSLFRFSRILRGPSEATEERRRARPNGVDDTVGTASNILSTNSIASPEGTTTRPPFQFRLSFDDIGPAPARNVAQAAP